MIQGRPPKFKVPMVRVVVSVEPEVKRWLKSKGEGNASEVVNNMCREQMKIENWVEEKIEELTNPETKYEPKDKEIEELKDEKIRFDETPQN